MYGPAPQASPDGLFVAGKDATALPPSKIVGGRCLRGL